MGPKLSRVTIFFGSDVLRLATEDYMQNVRLDRVLSDSGQHCVDLSLTENCNFGWGPNFMESPYSLVQMFYDLQRRITCCTDGTLAQDASPEH